MVTEVTGNQYICSIYVYMQFILILDILDIHVTSLYDSSIQLYSQMLQCIGHTRILEGGQLLIIYIVSTIEISRDIQCNTISPLPLHPLSFHVSHCVSSIHPCNYNHLAQVPALLCLGQFISSLFKQPHTVQICCVSDLLNLQVCWISRDIYYNTGDEHPSTVISVINNSLGRGISSDICSCDIWNKPFKCVECCYKLTQSRYLKEDMMVDIVEIPFKCVECCYYFTQSMYLKEHRTYYLCHKTL